MTRTNCDEAGDYVVPNVLSPRDLVYRPDNMDDTVLSSFYENRLIGFIDMAMFIFISN